MPLNAKKQDQLADWADTLASMGQAVIMFDEHQNMALATPQARTFLSGFWTIDQWAKLRLPDITTLCFENAVDDAGPSGLIGSILNTFGESQSGFSEVISTPDQKTLLIQMVGFQTTGTIILIKDITIYSDWYNKTQIVDKQHNMLLTAIEMATTGVALFDPTSPQSPILFVNQAFARIVQIPREHILGKPFRNVLPDCSGDDPECVFQRTVMDRPFSYRAQISIIENLGIIFISDITESKEKEEQIRHMQRLESVGKLAGGVAHDFNNILGIVKGYGHLLMAEFKDNAEATDALERIMNACNRGAGLAEQLLTISRKKQILPGQSCSAARVLDTIQKMMLPLLPHEVILKIDPPHPKLQFNLPEDQLHQIFMNLIINARDAMPMGGNITIHVESPTPDFPTHSIIRVEDSGSGIPPEVIERIFEPFFTTKELGKGTGLGLAVIYGIIQQYSGTIEVDSTMGLGTTFTLSLPAAIADEAITGPSTKSRKNANLSGKTIMLVEDEPDLRQPLATFLSQKGAAVIEADDGNTALALQDDITGQPIDLLISDIRMPGGLYGDDLARLWREIRPESQIILMSGYAEGRDVTDGCTDIFMPKPVDFDALLNTIYDLFEQKQVTS